eukprot:850722-Pelagomonas_calceolata.AAC.1
MGTGLGIARAPAVFSALTVSSSHLSQMVSLAAFASLLGDAGTAHCWIMTRQFSHLTCTFPPQIKRELLSLLSDEAYNSVQSFHSDSAVSFAVFLHHLGCLSDLRTQQPPDVLLQAMEVCGKGTPALFSRMY